MAVLMTTSSSAAPVSTRFAAAMAMTSSSAAPATTTSMAALAATSCSSNAEAGCPTGNRPRHLPQHTANHTSQEGSTIMVIAQMRRGATLDERAIAELRAAMYGEV